VLGGALLALSLVGSWATNQQLARFLADLDVQALHGAEQAFGRFVEQQRGHLLSQVGVLVDDTRVRSTVITPKFDEATVKDVLNDLKKASGASALAVLDVSGKVKVVTGADRLRQVDLGSSPVVKAAIEGPASDVWTFPEQVLVVAIAPVRTGSTVSALLMMGFMLGEPVLGAVQRTTGAHGALYVGEKLLASSSNDPGLAQALRQASIIQDGSDQLVRTDRDFFGRAVRTSESSTAAKAVWLVPQHHQGGRVGLLRVIVWMPALAVALTLVLIILFRSRNT
jgi:hypothetical protein